jgi:uncharacterized protein (TIGR03083 family)
MDVVPIDLSEALAALEAAGTRATHLIQAIPDANVRAEGLDWTLGQVAAHLVANMRQHTEWVQGQGKVDYCVPDLAAENARNIEAVATRRPDELAGSFSSGTGAFLTAARAADPSQVIPEVVGPDLSLADLACVLLGEIVVHGHDIARTVGRPWPIDRRAATLVVEGTMAILPEFIDRKAAAGVRATYELRLRGGPRFVVAVEDGEMQVERPGARPVDCRISADPVALLLVSYGRIGQWGPIGKGQMMAWGRKPWLALKFTSLFRNP